MLSQLLEDLPNGIYRIYFIGIDQYIFYLNNDKDVKLHDQYFVYVALKTHWCI